MEQDNENNCAVQRLQHLPVRLTVNTAHKYLQVQRNFFEARGLSPRCRFYVDGTNDSWSSYKCVSRQLVSVIVHLELAFYSKRSRYSTLSSS